MEKAAKKKNKESQPSKRSKRSKNSEDSAHATMDPASTSAQNVCSVCLGLYEDDLLDGVLQNDWVCCTNCDKWMHLDCLTTEGENYVCVLCNVPLK